MCLCLEVYRYLKCDSCQYFAGMLIHFRFGENFGIKAPCGSSLASETSQLLVKLALAGFSWSQRAFGAAAGSSCVCMGWQPSKVGSSPFRWTGVKPISVVKAGWAHMCAAGQIRSRFFFLSVQIPSILAIQRDISMYTEQFWLYREQFWLYREQF